MHALLSQELKHCWESCHTKPIWTAELPCGCSSVTWWSHRQQSTWKKDRTGLSAFLAAGEEVVEIAKEAAWTGRARRAISLPNKTRLYYNSGTGRQLSTASGGTFHISECARSMKQEATLFGVVQDNTEAPHKINITESQNSGLANVTEPMGKVKKKWNSSSQGWIQSHWALHCKSSVQCIFGGIQWSAHATADWQMISLT